MCGGAGTRLWPVSRQQFPKQLLAVAGNQSLLQETAARLSDTHFSTPIVVSGEEQRFFIKRQLQDSGAPIDAILLEPVGRNTAAAAALAASWLRASGRDELLLLMPSDHVIGDPHAFLSAVETGTLHAQEGAIVTFGAEPTGPNTQYGYIEADTDRPLADGAFRIARFHEKPSAHQAAEYLASGRFYWNAGIFLVKASTLLEEMRELLPTSLDAIAEAVAGATSDGGFIRPSRHAFERAENISIDNAIMERTTRGVVVPVRMNWSDIGAWDAVWRLAEKDQDHNAIAGDVVVADTRNSLLRSDGGAVLATLGLDGMAIVAVSDAILVAPMDRVADLKLLIEKVKQTHSNRVELPAKVVRPWGSYEAIASGTGFQVKRIIVEPGECLSLQSHAHRSEHWVVVRGAGEVTVGGDIFVLQQNESTYIPAGTKHRLANPGKAPLEVIEVQCGIYLGEDDITRFDDKYRRVEKRMPS